MTDDELAAARAARAQALSRQQRDALEILVLGDPRWAGDDRALADAIAEVLQLTLTFLVMMDATRTPWALALLARIQAAVLAETDTSAATRH